MVKNIKDGAEMEIQWGVSCIGDGILGLNPKNLTEYIHFISNVRARGIGLSEIYPGATNPFPWIDEMTQGKMTETNFFEGTVREYATGTLDW
jgi:ribonucleoside-diphosphate reductase beta chain